MCGDSHLPPAPESDDLVAIIHPVTHSPPALSRTNSNSSATSLDSVSNTPDFIQGRLRLSNTCHSTLLDLAHHDAALGSLYGKLSVRIHKYGVPVRSLERDVGNPVLFELPVDRKGVATSGVRLDLGVGGNGVVGRTVSIVDEDLRVLGEGILGRI